MTYRNIAGLDWFCSSKLLYLFPATAFKRRLDNKVIKAGEF